MATMAPQRARTQRFILLPAQGVRASSGSPANRVLLETFNQSMSGTAGAEIDGNSVVVVDSVHEDGPKLIEADDAAVAAINESPVPVRLVPEVIYPRPDLVPLVPLVLPSLPNGSGPAGPVDTLMVCVDSVTRVPLKGATVVAFTDFANRLGAKGRTDANGEVTLRLNGPNIERRYVYPPPNYWGSFGTDLPTGLTQQVTLTPVNLGYVDVVRHYYGASKFTPGTGVTVGIIDTGCGPHADLNLLGGRSTVTGSFSDDWADVDIHGTHVAGLVGASGGLRGVAPKVQLRAYRVFPKDDGASNYAILKAMIFAADDHCDIINLSLGGGPFDAIVAESVLDAKNQGMLVIIAAGGWCRRGRAPPPG